MKTVQLIAICLVVATSLALPKSPWVFFARVKDRLVPLTGMYRGQRFQGVSIFSYEDSLGDPTEFSFEDRQAYTTQFPERQSVGFYEGNLVFGLRVPAARMNLDSDWKVRSGPFYSCNLLNSPKHGIFKEVQDKRVSYCFEVDIYFLPYNRTTKSAMRPDSEGKFPVSLDEGEKPCSIHYYGSNALEDLAQDERDGRGYNRKCVIYINGKHLLKNPVYGSRNSCAYYFLGKHAREIHAQFINDYNGKCDIYVDGELLPRKVTHD